VVMDLVRPDEEALKLRAGGGAGGEGPQFASMVPGSSSVRPGLPHETSDRLQQLLLYWAVAGGPAAPPEPAPPAASPAAPFGRAGALRRVPSRCSRSPGRGGGAVQTLTISWKASLTALMRAEAHPPGGQVPSPAQRGPAAARAAAAHPAGPRAVLCQLGAQG